jgi:hypothetical protein
MKIFLASALLLLTVFLASCGTKTEIITNTYSGAEPGNIKGKVVLYDTIGSAIADASNVKVELEGTKYSTLTAKDGFWELKDIPAGTYPSLQYSRKNFATFKVHQDPWGGGFGAYLVGGGGTQYNNQELYEVSQISVNLTIRDFEDYTELIPRDTVISTINRTVYDTVIIPYGQATYSSRVLDVPKKNVYNYYGALFFSKQPDIDPTDTKTYLYTTSVGDYLYQTDNITGICNFTFTTPTLKQSGFVAGETVYCVSYFGNEYVSSSRYYDYEHTQMIYPGFSPNHSEVKSFILP